MAGSFAKGINPDRIPPDLRPKKATHKFHAVAVEDDGIRFDSKLEREFYRHLKEGVRDGFVVGFMRQVPFHLPGGTRHVVDFLVFHDGGGVDAIDVKGMETDSFRIKAREVVAAYPWMSFCKAKKVRGEWEFAPYVEGK